MPVISRFYGIVVFMFWKDHAPPHFHARYQDGEVTVHIRTGAVEGRIARRAAVLVEEWRVLHEAELLANWEAGQRKTRMKSIEPLE